MQHGILKSGRFGKYFKNLLVTEKIRNEILSLPMHPFLLTTEIEYICDKIKEFMEENQ